MTNNLIRNRFVISVTRTGEKYAFKIKFKNNFGAYVMCNNFSSPIKLRKWALEVFDFTSNIHYGKVNTRESKRILGRPNFKNIAHKEVLLYLCTIQSYQSVHIKELDTSKEKTFVENSNDRKELESQVSQYLNLDKGYVARSFIDSKI